MVMQTASLSFEEINVIIDSCEDIYGRCCIQRKKKWSLPHHNLLLSSLIKKVVHFLLSRINKLDRDFLYWKNLPLVCPLRKHVTSLLSDEFLSACKDGGYRELNKVYCSSLHFSCHSLQVVYSLHFCRKFRKSPSLFKVLSPSFIFKWIAVSNNAFEIWRNVKLLQPFLRKLFDIRFSYKHCNFSRPCLLVKISML